MAKFFPNLVPGPILAAIKSVREASFGNNLLPKKFLAKSHYLYLNARLMVITADDDMKLLAHNYIQLSICIHDQNIYKFDNLN